MRNTKQSFTIKGVTCTPNLKDMEQLNFDNKLLGMQKEILQWPNKQIPPFGKITIVKGRLLLKLTHLFSALPKPSVQCVKKGTTTV